MLNIEKFEEILEQQVIDSTLAPETLEYYVSCMSNINKYLSQNPVADVRFPGREIITPTQIETAIMQLCKTNKQVSKFISAVRKYEKDVLHKEKTLLYGEPYARLREFCKNTDPNGKPLVLPEQTYEKKYNRLNNKKLKLAFRLQAKSGLRVSEIADLTSEDVTFHQDGKIDLQVRNGKGRKAREVHVMDDGYLYAELQQHIADSNKEEKLFYSSAYLRKKAREYGMQTHDLRRINARKRYRAEIEEGKGKRQAKRAVGHELGHENVKTTNVYINGDGEDY